MVSLFENFYKKSSLYTEQEASIQKLVNEILDKNDKIKELTDSLDNIKNSYASLMSDNEQLEEKLRQTSTNLTYFKNKYEDLKSLCDSVSVIKSKIKNLENMLDLKKNEYDRALVQLQIKQDKETESANEKYQQSLKELKFEYIKKYRASRFSYIRTLSNLKLKFSKQIDEYENSLFLNEYKNLRNYISKEEFFSLESAKRYQLALDRYNNVASKSSQRIGLEYERYIGYLLEMKGYTVRYHGALNKFKDNGIDIIAEDRKTIIAIQCKNWKSTSVVRENTITQLSGSLQLLKNDMPSKSKKYVAILCTTTNLSNEALENAKKLNVRVYENFKLEPYPLIKCNNSKSEKIYHMPFDQMYDKVFIRPKDGDFYASTTSEAESAGYRHAHVWHPDNV